MIPWTTVDAASPDPVGEQLGGASMLASNGLTVLGWVPTARGIENFDGSLGTKAQLAARTSQTCYQVGLRETITIATTDGNPWEWRRICFTMKGERFFQNGSDPATSDWFRQTSDGYVRWLNRVPDSVAPIVNDYIFKGVAQVDWTEIMNAPLDSSRVSVMYDKTKIIRSGNASGQIYKTKRWHKMYKNLMYGDDESGETEEGFPLSTFGKPGMGDYYVLDFFRCLQGGASVLNFTPESTLYWHER